MAHPLLKMFYILWNVVYLKQILLDNLLGSKKEYSYISDTRFKKQLNIETFYWFSLLYLPLVGCKA